QNWFRRLGFIVALFAIAVVCKGFLQFLPLRNRLRATRVRISRFTIAEPQLEYELEKHLMKTPGRRIEIAEEQLNRLRQMLETVLAANEFYRKKFSADGSCEIRSMESLKNLPFTTKSELAEDQIRHPPFGTDLTFSQEHYIRVHQTSGTSGNPMYWLDTE